MADGVIRHPDRCLHLDLDGAWSGQTDFQMDSWDARGWGPKLRFCAPPSLVEAFYREAKSHLKKFTLYGSGDFHYLTALWLRRFEEPFTLIGFDNHPDWDIRPPRWSCGGWMNRALELENLQVAAVWGCGNFELRWPNRIFGNRTARLQLFPWEERYPKHSKGPWTFISRLDWRQRFEAFIDQHRRQKIYVTIDMDCLDSTEAITNWENGMFKADDLVWALSLIHSKCEVIGGDLCGAYSPPGYARWTQKFAGTFDHPKISVVDEKRARELNLQVLGKIFPALTGGDKDHAQTDQYNANP